MIWKLATAIIWRAFGRNIIFLNFIFLNLLRIYLFYYWLWLSRIEIVKSHPGFGKRKKTINLEEKSSFNSIDTRTKPQFLIQQLFNFAIQFCLPIYGRIIWITTEWNWNLGYGFILAASDMDGSDADSDNFRTSNISSLILARFWTKESYERKKTVILD